MTDTNTASAFLSAADVAAALGGTRLRGLANLAAGRPGYVHEINAEEAAVLVAYDCAAYAFSDTSKLITVTDFGRAVAA